MGVEEWAKRAWVRGRLKPRRRLFVATIGSAAVMSGELALDCVQAHRRSGPYLVSGYIGIRPSELPGT